jgi:hypothetical protein
MEELAKLERLGTIRILDLLFVQKDPDSGDVVVLDVQGDDLGGIVGALLGFAFEGSNGAPRRRRRPATTTPSGSRRTTSRMSRQPSTPAIQRDSCSSSTSGLATSSAPPRRLAEPFWGRAS